MKPRTEFQCQANIEWVRATARNPPNQQTRLVFFMVGFASLNPPYIYCLFHGLGYASLPLISAGRARSIVSYYEPCTRRRHKLNHSSQDTPACFRIFAKSVTPTACLCGLGSVSRKVPFYINKCLPPAKGPSKPKARNRLTNSCQETGANFAVTQLLLEFP
jgi:hypothetical protein